MKKINNFKASWEEVNAIIHKGKNALQKAVESRRMQNKSIKEIGAMLDALQDAIYKLAKNNNNNNKK